MIYITPAETKHIEAMLGRIRQADYDEFAAGYSLTPERGLAIGLKVSTHCWAGIWDGKVIAIAGLNPISFLGDEAHPWMVGTRDLERPEIRREFLELSKSVLLHMLSIYPRLENWVDVRNRMAVRWLKWLGFTMHDPEPYGPKGMLFHRFELMSPAAGPQLFPVRGGSTADRPDVSRTAGMLTHGPVSTSIENPAEASNV